MDWFLYDTDLCHERVKVYLLFLTLKKGILLKKITNHYNHTAIKTTTKQNIITNLHKGGFKKVSHANSELFRISS